MLQNDVSVEESHSVSVSQKVEFTFGEQAPAMARSMATQGISDLMFIGWFPGDVRGVVEVWWEYRRASAKVAGKGEKT